MKAKQKQKESLFDVSPPPIQDRTRLVQSHYRCIHLGCGGRIELKENICPKCGKTQADF